MTALLIAKRIFGALPIWAWVLLAVLAWGGMQRHQAKALEREKAQAVQKAAQDEIEQVRADLEESKRRNAEVTNAAIQAQKQAAQSAAAVDRLRATEQRLRDKVAAIEAIASGNNPGAPPGSQAAEEARGLLAKLYGSCRTRVIEVSRFADQAMTAAEACERSYDSLTKGKP